MAEKIATRDAYGKALAELGRENPDVRVLDADLAEATKTIYFKKEFPERFFDCGIAEQNMISVAAGMAAAGKIPFASSFAMFAAGRAFEQIRNAVAYPHLNVKICATHGGITVGEDGATHQCLEDIALMRSIPGMVVINPSDAVQARKAVFAAAKYDGPVYMRFGRLALPVIYDEDSPFEIGKANVLKKGSDVTIITSGMPLENTLLAAKELEGSGLSVGVIDMATIKPLDKQAVIDAARESGAIVTVEEHNVIGGLGSAVCELLSKQLPTPVVRVGVNDTFGKSGKALELVELFGLGVSSIAEAAKKAVGLKK